MKKNIIIILLLIFTTLFILYGYIKAKEAELNLLAARDAMEEAERQTEIATMAAAELRRAEALLEECQSQ